MSGSVIAITSPESPVGGSQVGQIVSRARVLIGWMRPDNAEGILRSSTACSTSAQATEAARRAREAVDSRPPDVDQKLLLVDVPARLAGHIEALRDSPAAQPMFAEGWRVALVDLTRVCGFQPVVVCREASERVQSVVADDLTSIAKVTLPLTQGEPVPVQYDSIRRAWIVISENHNLRIAGNIDPIPINPNGTALGFAVVAGPSFMQVARYHGRHFLRDGYHRAVGLLDRGITTVPAFVRDITTFEELLADPRVMLPQDSYSRARPPVLPDYLNDSVSTEVHVPVVHKMVVIQALELTPIG